LDVSSKYFKKIHCPFWVHSKGLITSIFVVNMKTIGPSKNILWGYLNLEVQNALEGCYVNAKIVWRTQAIPPQAKT
jgi:hypothetical protein